MLAEQGEDFVLVFGCHHALEDIVLLFRLLLFAELDVAAHQQEHGYADEDEHAYEAGVVHQDGDDGTNGEGYECGDEPSADDGEHAGDAVNGTFASPGTVGK